MDVFHSIIIIVRIAGLNAVSYVYPKVKIVTSAVDDVCNVDKHCLVPGMGNFGDRFFGTDLFSSDEELDDGFDYNIDNE